MRELGGMRGSGCSSTSSRLLRRGTPRARARDVADACCARIAAASSAALVAPASPIASVPTGTPAGICTIDSSESRPLSAFDCTGTPSTGSVVFAARHARQVRRAAGAGDDHLEPALARASPRTRTAGRACGARRRRALRGRRRGARASRRRRIVSQSDFEPMMMPTSGFIAALYIRRWKNLHFDASKGFAQLAEQLPEAAGGLAAACSGACLASTRICCSNCRSAMRLPSSVQAAASSATNRSRHCSSRCSRLTR